MSGHTSVIVLPSTTWARPFTLPPMNVSVGEVSEGDAAFDAVCELFDDYRAHYGQRRSARRVRAWLGQQSASGNLRVMAATMDGLPRGFVTTTASPASLSLGTALLVR